jgi:benzoyl-CoA 2,3-dioxygenase component B
MSSVVNDTRIPNNVDLSSDKKLQRALEEWQPNFINWWQSMGPEGFQQDDVFLRTAISVDHEGWANFDYVKMPEYRWGIFLADATPDRTIGFGDEMGKPVWQQVPGEHRNTLRRLIVTQGDTEPASVEQQRLLGQTCPSLYDLRNLFQVNVEEGRHLWAMVYLLHSHFGRDGREEAEALLQRRSGDPDSPRILGTFNEPCPEWLSFFMFTFFTDRDGKYQLLALAESAFDPLSRTTRFMLTEEAHHMFVGETGILRVVQRSAELAKLDPNGDVRAQGGVDLPTIQKYLNYWFSSSVDLFGGEVSSNAAAFFASGLKGRAKEAGYEDHVALNGTYRMTQPENGALVERDVALRSAMNEVLRDEYIGDCQRGVDKWNRAIAEAGVDFVLKIPSRRFNRNVGLYAGMRFAPTGEALSEEAWAAGAARWLPTAADRAYVLSLMTKPVYEPGKMAHWIAAPKQGIKGRPADFEYVRHDAR